MSRTSDVIHPGARMDMSLRPEGQRVKKREAQFLYVLNDLHGAI
jgi:hypothetical protein